MTSPRAFVLWTLGLLLVQLNTAHAMYEDGDGVKIITGETFEKAVIGADGPALVEFFIPGCGHCQALVPEYKKVARNLQGLATVAAVDCSNEASKTLCSRNVNKGFPTIKVYGPDKKTNPYTGGPMKEETLYEGARTARALSAAVTDGLHTGAITSITSKPDLDIFLNTYPTLAKVLLFTDKPQSTVLYKALSLAYVGRLRFAEVRPDAEEVVQQYQVHSYPTLIIVKADGSDGVYDGPLKALPLREALDEVAAAEPVAEAHKEAAGGAAGGAGAGGGGQDKKGREDGPPGLPSLEAHVHNLTVGNLSSIDAEAAMWLIGFYSSAGGPCTSQVAAATRVLKEVQEVVQLGLLDVVGEELGPLRSYGLDTAALGGEGGCQVQLLLFPAGEDKQDQEAYLKWEGGLDDAKALQKWILEEVPDTTMLLTGKEQLQMFAAMTLNPAAAAGSSKGESEGSSSSSQPLGKVVLFASKQEVPGVYKALAQQMTGKANYMFGWIQPGSTFAEEAMKQMHVVHVPSLVAVVPAPAGSMTAEQRAAHPPGQTPLSIQPYVGPLKFQSMKAWLQAMAMLTGLSDDKFPGLVLNEDGPPATTSAALKEITNNHQLTHDCLSPGAICVLALLNGPARPTGSSSSDGASSSGSGSSEGWELVKGLARKFAEQPLRFAAVDASQQKSLRSGLGLEGGAGEVLPALVVVSGKRQRYAVMPGTFTRDTAEVFLGRVLSGGVTTAPLQSGLEYVEGGEVEEVPAEVVEDEFGLSDIMSEEVDAAILSKEEQLRKVEEELRAAKEAEAAAAAASKKSKSKKKKKKAKQKKAASKAREEL